MKIAVMNYSGNVGKSTVARHLLAPRIPNATVIAVESINSDGSTDDEAIRGKQFGLIQEAILLSDSCIIDVGASNVEDFMLRMKDYRGSHEDLDLFIIPTVPKTKQMRDTISTVDALADLGVPSKKIRVVLNMLEPDEDPRRVCEGLFRYCDVKRTCVVNPGAVIRVNEIYGKLNGTLTSMQEILADKTDYRSALQTAQTSDEKVRCAQRIALRRLAAGVVEELDSVFRHLLGE